MSGVGHRYQSLASVSLPRTFGHLRSRSFPAYKIAGIQDDKTFVRDRNDDKSILGGC